MLSNLQHRRRTNQCWVVTASLVSFVAGYSVHSILSLQPNFVADIQLKDLNHSFDCSDNVASTPTRKEVGDAATSSPKEHSLDKNPFPDLPLNSSSVSSSLPSSSLLPQVAWLLSFPNSGTSYTMVNVEQLTNCSIASNYASGEALSVGLDENGPFADKTHPLPQNYILTKTHCGAYCSTCGAHLSVLNTAEEFEEQCRRSTRPDDPKQTKRFYPNGTATRAIHLIRHPVDNLVSRLHLFLKKYHRGQRDPRHYEGFDTQVAQQKTERERMLAWCRYTDMLQGPNFAATPRLTNSTKHIIQHQQPLCALELFRYIQWHQRALEMTKQLGLHVLYIYYEDYMTQYNTTVSRILDFLETTPAVGAEPRPFVSHPPYDVFTEEERDSIVRYLQQLASSEGWALVEHYFQ